MSEQGLTSFNANGLADPKMVEHICGELQKFVRTQKLTVIIKGNNYVMVEGWQYAGTQLGLVPRPVSCERIKGLDGEVKYKSEVEIYDLNKNIVIGRGFAYCSNFEAKKKGFEEYAIASMSQTRATGKAFRLLIGWMMKASGFETTPYEEMDTVMSVSESTDQKLRDEILDYLLTYTFTDDVDVDSIGTGVEKMKGERLVKCLVYLTENKTGEQSHEN